MDWFQAPRLQSMDLTGNLFSGTIPATIPASTVVPIGFDALLTGLQETVAMRRLSLASNLLEGTIPAGLWRYRLQACFGAWRLYCLEACSYCMEEAEFAIRLYCLEACSYCMEQGEFADGCWAGNACSLL